MVHLQRETKINVMQPHYRNVEVQASNSSPLQLSYLDQPPQPGKNTLGTILLLHGFPQTAHQFRHIIPHLAKAGYRCIAPDYRGAGRSSKAVSDFRKSTMAADMFALLEALEISEPVHVVGHDIGGMIAYNLASIFPDRVESVCWGECPLPGTRAYEVDRKEHAVDFFHFIFHSVPDLPEALVEGKERIYVSHFLNKITYNFNAFSEADIDFYARAYAQPGAMRCAFGVYRAFEVDAAENRERVAEHGKCGVRSLILTGEHSRHRAEAEEMALEVTEEEKLTVEVIGEACHYLAEENPEGFADAVLRFVAGSQ